MGIGRQSLTLDCSVAADEGRDQAHTVLPSVALDHGGEDLIQKAAGFDGDYTKAG